MKPTIRQILKYMVWFCGKSKTVVHPSLEKIAQRFKICHTYASTLLNKLKKSGLLFIRRSGPYCNEYTVAPWLLEIDFDQSGQWNKKNQQNKALKSLEKSNSKPDSKPDSKSFVIPYKDNSSLVGYMNNGIVREEEVVNKTESGISKEEKEIQTFYEEVKHMLFDDEERTNLTDNDFWGWIQRYGLSATMGVLKAYALEFQRKLKSNSAKMIKNGARWCEFMLKTKRWKTLLGAKQNRVLAFRFKKKIKDFIRRIKDSVVEFYDGKRLELDLPSDIFMNTLRHYHRLVKGVCYE